MAEKPIEDARSNSSKAANQKRSRRTAQVKQPIRSVREGQLKRSSQSEAFAKDSSSEVANQKRLPRTNRAYRPIKLCSRSREGASLVQSNSSGRKQGERLVTQDGSIGPTNRSHRSDYLRTDFLWTEFLRTDHPSC